MTALSDLARAALADDAFAVHDDAKCTCADAYGPASPYCDETLRSNAATRARSCAARTREPELARGVLELLAEREGLVADVRFLDAMVLRLTKQLAESEEETALVCRDWAAETVDLTKQLAEAKSEIEPLRERRFPIMGGPSVPWSMVAPYEAQAKANHDQTLERLAERGGLAPQELWCIVHGKRWKEWPQPDVALLWLNDWLRAVGRTKGTP